MMHESASGRVSRRAQQLLEESRVPNRIDDAYSPCDADSARDADTALRESRAKTDAIVGTIIDGIVTIDERGVIDFVNPAAEKTFGYSSGELIGQKVNMLMCHADAEKHDSYIQRYLDGGQPHIIGIGREVAGRRKDGRTFPMHLGVGTFSHGGKRMFVGIVRDLTEYRRLQEESLTRRNLVALGEMAASVAHQIKNPLAVISGVTQVLVDNLPKDSPHVEIAGELLQRIGMLDLTVKRLLMFARPWRPEKQLFSLSEISAHVVDSARRLGDFDSIRFEIADGVRAEAQVDLSLVQDVFWNLLHNAAQAMPQGGHILIDFEESREEAIVRLQDDGVGIAPESLDELFRPFYTTKSSGTGLGLPICRRIMEAHGGSIRILSSPGEGTTVELRFPKAT